MTKASEKWMVIVAVLLGTFTVILNNSMLNPAIPRFQIIFHSNAVAVGWIISIFMLTMGMTMPLTGYLGDKWGKKKLFMFGLAMFIIVSFFGSFSWNLRALIFFRGLQGIAGGLMMPLSMALIFDAFPRHERGLATGVWGIAAMVAPTIGPTLGGVLIQYSNWHYLLLANLPTGILGLIISGIYLKPTEKNPNKVFDGKGFALVTIGIGSILLALGRITTFSDIKDTLNIFLLLIGLMSLFVFTKVELKKNQPLLRLTLFKTKTFSISVLISSMGSMALFVSVFLVPLLIQNVYGYGGVMTGLVLVPSAILTGICMNIGGRILDKQGPLKIVTTGLTTNAVVMILLGLLTIKSPIWMLFVLMGLRGVGMGFTNMPATTTGMNAIPDHLVAQGSAMNNVIRQVVSAFSIVFVSIFYHIRVGALFAVYHSQKLAALHAIKESFLLIGIFLTLIIPAGIMLGRSQKKLHKRDVSVSS